MNWLLSRALDRLFGKRYRKGWPRGVRPIADYFNMSNVEFHRATLDLRRNNPGLYNEIKAIRAYCNGGLGLTQPEE